jgi:uncharacterized protein YjbJ (UPF0337 family)
MFAKNEGEEVFLSVLILERRNIMKSSTKDEAKGKFHEVKGKIKEVAGQIIGNTNLEAEGTGEKIAGKVQEQVGKVEKVLGA